jgi:hypothetical protein
MGDGPRLNAADCGKDRRFLDSLYLDDWCIPSRSGFRQLLPPRKSNENTSFTRGVANWWEFRWGRLSAERLCMHVRLNGPLDGQISLLTEHEGVYKEGETGRHVFELLPC